MRSVKNSVYLPTTEVKYLEHEDWEPRLQHLLLSINIKAIMFGRCKSSLTQI